MTPPKRRRSWIAPLAAWTLLTAPLPAALLQTGNVEPDVSAWTSSTTGYIGRTSDGSVTVDAGSLLASQICYLGYCSGSTGAATITGEGSKWTNSIYLYVGLSGAGALTIEAGGQVSNTVGFLGSSSMGTVTVTGTGSKLTNSGSLVVGGSGGGSVGDGTLIIEAGGEVSSGDGYVGISSGSTGTVMVTGAGSKWTHGSRLSIGYAGAGMLTIEEGGLASIRGPLKIDTDLNGDSFINMTTGGMLAIYGDADDSLNQFLGLISGTDDAIRFWNDSLSDWVPLTTATFGLDYTLEYLATGDLAGYTLLTVGEALSPGPAGDFNADGTVDGADFLAWQRGESPDPLGAEDLDVWKNGFGDVGPSTVAAQVAVPEPASLSLLALGLGALPRRRPLRRRRFIIQPGVGGAADYPRKCGEDGSATLKGLDQE